ncbi:MAG TPA: TlpA disulfide reductase family protein [Flavobacteriales bacterium]|nr:TlpA disulfide reductase family protein [Flavobacteriales bacterium]
MKRILAACLLLTAMRTTAQDAIIQLKAPAHAGQVAQLYRYDDLFTLRTVRIASALLDDRGNGELTGTVTGTARLRIRIGDVHGDLFARPGSRYTITFNPPDARTARTIRGTARTDLVFHELEPLDVNALTSDLNARIDGFIAEDLATDEAAGMQALPVVRKEGTAPDSLRRPPTLFVMPSFSKARIDSFETRVRHFYRDVNDAWFGHYLTFSFAGMRHGPRVNEADLFKSHLSGRPVLYDDPEYTRFIRSFFAEQLAIAQRMHGQALVRAYAIADADSLKAVLAHSEFLKDDRLCELVMIDLLHQQYHGPSVIKASALAILKRLADGSRYAEHRVIAGNAYWDLTAMNVGETLPATRLHDLNGRAVNLDSLMKGPVCVVVTASWCTYCDQELQGLEPLNKEVGSVVPVIAIILDHDIEAARRYVRQRPGMTYTWLHAEAEQQLRDDWRIVSLPSFYLLNDGVLAQSPAPAPSRGLGALLHSAKANAAQDGRIKVWDD